MDASTSANTSDTWDFLVVGAGIAGASVAYWLAPHGKTLLLERESQPGYHSTGRSAALFMASYGGPQVRALTLASLPFYADPPEGFSEHPLISPRGALMVAAPGQEDALDAHWQVLLQTSPQARRLTTQEACALVSVLKPEQVVGAALEPDAMDMDVHAIHQGFLRGMRRQGGALACDAEVTSLRHDGGHWHVQAADGRRWTARVLVNAAGAWADELGRLAGAQTIGLQPCRRSAFVFTPPEGVSVEHWPMTYSAGEDWYIKPDAGVLLGSPANADPVPPHDVQPEELDIAMAMHAIGEMTTLSMRRPLRTWAGLRSFVADGGLVGGMDAQVPNFVWVAAQGGYGIQTAPAMGESCATLARGLPLPAHIAAQGLTAGMLEPRRLLAG
ncbi:MAG: FAD-binding oxidoreductase [Burkholderiales bacterium]|nr:FAD-binding oxidoreductase [Burkholderiales bacterium]